MTDAAIAPTPLSTILVGTDLSEDALAAVQAGALLARGAGAALHVLHAEPAGGSAPPGTASSLLRHHVGHVMEEDETVQLHVASGPPFRALAEAADRLPVSLVVVGSHRPRRLFDGLLGTTADRVLRTSRQPVLVVNRSLLQTPVRVLVATDLSPTADRALALAVDWALAWHRPQEGEGDDPLFELLHVSAFAHPGYHPTSPTAPLRARSDGALQRSGGRIRIRPRILSAPLAPEGILRAAEEMRADLLVLGTHGHGGLVRPILGSVASEVARTLPFPVLMVPPA
jgi:universal stress protein E